MSEGAPKAKARASVPPHVRPLRILLYVLTVAAAAAALFLQPALAGAVQRGALPRAWLFLPLGIYTVFFLVYAADRVSLVRRGFYPAGRAFFQLAFGVVFALLLLPSTISNWNDRRPSAVDRLAGHPDADVRLLTVEALGYRGPSPENARRVAARLDDRAPEVRERARAILAAWSGRPTASPDELKGWAEALTSTDTATVSH
ncbi:MAG: hypothetical protein KC933_32160 [Myxococcales bacterium]|nr:hypothetical protein [Myxococcales bacterium]MCB9645035.1 hypothetical protein [Deltaproteobacteria bacterium]